MSGDFGPLSPDRFHRASDPDLGPSEPDQLAEGPGSADDQLDLEPWGSQPWRLPGQGEPGPRCGEWYPSAVCETCGHVDLGTHQCGRRSCPDCWGRWALDAGVRATRRLQSFRYQQPEDWHRQVVHVSVDPPKGAVRTEREFWDYRSEAWELASEKGLRGGMVVGHPWRVTEEGKERFEQEDPDHGIWVWLRNEVDGMDRYLRWSPHYHVIGAATPDMDPGTDEDEGLYRWHRSLESFEGIRDEASHKDLFGVVRYLLSHIGFPEGSTKQGVTWYGQLANSVFVEDATESWQTQKPSEGVRSALKREIEKAVGKADEEDEEDEAVGVDDEGECPRDDCGGFLIDVFDVAAFLDHADPPPEVVDVMTTCRDWRLGRVEPPPGLKHPRTREQAEETLAALLEG